ncbi:hypothetical protein GF319_15180 [Candidatus Bathyarchaeota archaeon]|nr:hypothetical protein [Candidatus Bathyarchaeota archaeon]
MKSIKNDVESTLLSLEENLVETSPRVEQYQKDLLFKVMKERSTDQYIAQQRRIRALRDPISTAIGVFQRFLGDNKVETQELEIDTSILEVDFQDTRMILDSLDLEQSIRFFNESMKHGLKKSNQRWMKDMKG